MTFTDTPVGDYKFYCLPHLAMKMTGKITVTRVRRTAVTEGGRPPGPAALCLSRPVARRSDRLGLPHYQPRDRNGNQEAGQRVHRIVHLAVDDTDRHEQRRDQQDQPQRR